MLAGTGFATGMKRAGSSPSRRPSGWRRSIRGRRGRGEGVIHDGADAVSFDVRGRVRVGVPVAEREQWALCGFAIGGANLALYKLAPNANGTEIAAYLSGGPLGIICAMKAHGWMRRRMKG